MAKTEEEVSSTLLGRCFNCPACSAKQTVTELGLMVIWFSNPRGYKGSMTCNVCYTVSDFDGHGSWQEDKVEQKS